MKERALLLPPARMKDRHYAEIHGVLFEPALREAVDFKRNVASWIADCRLRDAGVPMFRTRYADTPFKAGEVNYMLGVCFLGRNLITSQWFRNVPLEDFDYATLRRDDYKYFIRKYGSPELAEAVRKAPVVVV